MIIIAVWHVRELASSVGPSQLFNVACWKIQVGAPGMWSHVHHTIKPFKLVARNVQIHSDLWLLPCDMWYTNFVYQALSLIACSTRKAGNRDYHGARKAVTHNKIQFLHNKNLADATSNYTNYVAASGQVTQTIVTPNFRILSWVFGFRYCLWLKTFTGSFLPLDLSKF